MIEVTLSFVPRGGGEKDKRYTTLLPGVPNPGDYLRVLLPDKNTEDFIIRRCWRYIAPVSKDETSIILASL